MIIDPHGRKTHGGNGAAENLGSNGGGPAGKGKAPAKAKAKAKAGTTAKTKVTVLAAALEKVIAAGEGYKRWPAIVLQKMCTGGRRKGLSACKVRTKMVLALQAQDLLEDRESPYMGDLRIVLQGEKKKYVIVCTCLERPNTPPFATTDLSIYRL